MAQTPAPSAAIREAIDTAKALRERGAFPVDASALAALERAVNGVDLAGVVPGVAAATRCVGCAVTQACGPVSPRRPRRVSAQRHCP